MDYNQNNGQAYNASYAQQSCGVQRMVGFGEALKRGFQNYANFNGRASRSEYWWWALSSLICCIPILGWIYGLVILVPTIALVVRRLHDTNRSGFWFLIGLVPVIGGICLLIFELMPSTEGTNNYGEMPNLQ